MKDLPKNPPEKQFVLLFEVSKMSSSIFNFFVIVNLACGFA
jgi:hypothetical protein